MKKILMGILFSILMLGLTAAALADVTINETNFPDAQFRKVVREFDTNRNGKLSSAEIDRIEAVQCENMGITSLKGIEYFTELANLYCSGNKLTSLDVRKFPRLNLLYCDGNQLTSLDLSKNPWMEWLKCENNRIESLDFSKCPHILYAICNNNRLSSLKLKDNDKLCYLYAYGNSGLKTLDVSTCGCLDWVVKHGEIEGSCNFQGWFSNDFPYEVSFVSQILLYVPSGTKVITRVEAESITLSETRANLIRTSSKKFPKLQLTATVLPEDASSKSVEWTSSNPGVAKVDKKGKVTALKAGKAVITCRAKDGSGVKATCTITVEDKKVSRIVLNKKKSTLAPGKTLWLKVKTLKPSNALSKKVKWSSSNKKVATVDKKGKVRAIGKGTCEIVCTAADGSGIRTICTVTVK